MSVWPVFFANDTDAKFSDCNKYRYALWRKWNENLPPLVFLMLNPSKANEVDNDATITRCIGFAKREGSGGIIVANMFALCSTNPAGLYTAADPIGPENAVWLERVCQCASKVVVAWGNEPIARGREADILNLLNVQGIPAYCLGKNKQGSPKHPVRLHGDTPLIPYP